MSYQDFDPDLPASERDELERLAARLIAERPIPRAGFRAYLRGRLARGNERRHLRLQAAAYLASGVALLLVAALGVNDLGPLAPQAPAGGTAQAQLSVQPAPGDRQSPRRGVW
jgi:hypothetical protein